LYTCSVPSIWLYRRYVYKYRLLFLHGHTGCIQVDTTALNTSQSSLLHLSRKKQILFF